MTRVNLPFCHTNLTVVWNGGLTALVIAFDMALTENEFGPKKVDRNDDLTALVIWPEGESLLYFVFAGYAVCLHAFFWQHDTLTIYTQVWAEHCICHDAEIGQDFWL